MLSQVDDQAAAAAAPTAAEGAADMAADPPAGEQPAPAATEGMEVDAKE
jgi:hypothetical protein